MSVKKDSQLKISIFYLIVQTKNKKYSTSKKPNDKKLNSH